MTRKEKLFISIITLSVIFFLPNQKPAYAYLDPGTGSFIFQVIAGILLTSLYIIKKSFKNIKIFLTRLLSKKQRETTDE